MKNKLNYRRSRLMEGIRMLIILELTAAAFVFATFYLKNVDDPQLVEWIRIAIIVVSVLAALFLVLPHLKNSKQVFIYQCDGLTVHCDCPGLSPVKYTLNFADIDFIKRYISKQRGTERHYIVDKKGKEYEIPQRFGFHVGKAIKSITGFRSNIKVIKHIP